MSDKLAVRLVQRGILNARRLALGRLKRELNMKQKETKAVSKRILHLDARVTQEEYDAVKKRAD